MKYAKKPCLFWKCHDSNIYKIDVIGIAIVKPNGDVSTKEISDPDVDDFWFIIKMFNDGKCGGKRVNHAEYKYNKYSKQWCRSIEVSTYIIHYQLEKYYHVVTSNMDYTNGYFLVHGKQVDDITIIANCPHVSQPSLGPRNVIKIKTAIRKYLERVRRG
jgi:hypothetical protein